MWVQSERAETKWDVRGYSWSSHLQPSLACINLGRQGTKRVTLVSRLPKTTASSVRYGRTWRNGKNTSQMNLPDFNCFAEEFRAHKRFAKMEYLGDLKILFAMPFPFSVNILFLPQLNGGEKLSLNVYPPWKPNAKQWQSSTVFFSLGCFFTKMMDLYHLSRRW